ncbi:unnamed protein product [Triticum turgidum subsp. durum]|uniref:Auxin-responsive protein n=1 Tax=Triticum turgidum subsp. durum TaxID=4567 RepID=A0A9R0WQY8_TRITD|nr:unnamed protein product [Triticum turgidum subsp. durum]
MVGAKRLAQLAKKLQRVEALGRKRLTVSAKEDEDCYSSVPAKGHCVMYTADGGHFEVPLEYLSTTVFGELLRMSQEEFGFASDGGIRLPCDAAVMEYAMCLLRRKASAEVESALLKTTMMSTKNLAQLAKKWQRVVAMGRKRLTSSTSGEETGGPCGTSCSPVAGKGHFVVYTTDGARFEVPLAFLGTTVFDELLRMSQEEFGFTGVDGGRITLPCDASMMEYAMCLLRRNASSEMEAAFLNTMAMPCHYHVEPHLGVSQHYGVCSS